MQNLGTVLKSLEGFLLEDPTEFHQNWRVSTYHPDGSSFCVEAGLGVRNDYDPFSDHAFLPDTGHMVAVHWSADLLDKGEKEEIVKAVDLAARWWCQRVHDWHGCDDDEPDFYQRVQYSLVVGECAVCATFDESYTKGKKERVA